MSTATPATQDQERRASRGARSGDAHMVSSDLEALAVDVLEHGHAEDEHEEHGRLGRRVAEVVALEGLAVEVEHDHVGRAGRSAARQHEDLVEDLEGQDAVVDEEEGGRRGEQRAA